MDVMLTKASGLECSEAPIPDSPPSQRAALRSTASLRWSPRFAIRPDGLRAASPFQRRACAGCSPSRQEFRQFRIVRRLLLLPELALECAPVPRTNPYFCFRSSRRMASSASMTSSRWTRALLKLSFRLNCLVGGR